MRSHIQGVKLAQGSMSVMDGALKADETLSMGGLLYLVDGKACSSPLVPQAPVLTAEQREQLRRELNKLAGRDVF